MELIDAPATKRPNLYHTHRPKFVGEHVHDIDDHYGRTFEQVTHSHDQDGNVTVDGGRHKPPKQTFA